MTKEPLYGLAADIVATQRKTVEHDIGPWIGLTSGKVKIRVSQKREQDVAVIGAHDYAAKLCESNPEAAKDPDILDDAKCAFIACVAMRDADQPEKLPAFPSPGWMMENMTADQIGVLVNLVNEVRVNTGPAPKRLDDDQLDSVVSLCSKHASDEIPQLVLANMSREVLSHVVVMLSLRLARLEQDEPIAKPDA
jgi:hypothetical protein